MSAWFASGRIADIILILTAFEAIALVALFRSTGHGIPPAHLLPTLAAGAGLLAAMRFMLTGAWWGISALCLLAALLAHLTDLRVRWRRG